MSLSIMYVVLLVTVVSFSGASRHGHSLKGACPSVCQCKWKGGKQAVECIDRALITIPENVDPESQVLDLSDNNLQILPRETFKRVGLVNMQRVFLRNCRIGQIDEKSFLGLSNLVELDLSFNLITSIPTGIFPDVHFLRDLTLAHNPIQKIETHAFVYARNLIRLDMSDCALEMISPKAFEGIEQLETLKLNGNKLSEIRPRTIEILQRLHSIELHDNPWHCDCRMRGIKEFIMLNNIPSPVAPICTGGPERILDKSFTDLHIDEFACKPEILPVSRYIEAMTGDNATLICRVSAVPAPEIKWFQNGRLLANNSAYSTFQRVYVYSEGQFEKRSKLVLTNSQEVESTEFYCVAENRAGSAEANFTLHVALRTAGISSLGSGQIIGLSAALVILILFILLLIFILLLRLRRIPFTETKTPGQIEVVTVVNGNTIANGKSAITTPTSTIETSSFIERKPPSDLKIECTNPIQKPPRLTDMPYSTSHYNGGGSVINSGPCFISPSSASGNNPDLINDMKRFGSGEIPTSTTEAVSVTVESTMQGEDTRSMTETTTTTLERPGSGEYSRNGSESLYPSMLWEGSSSSDLYLRRVGSSNLTYDDKTPIIGDGTSAGGSEDESTDYCSKSLPRSHHSMAHVNPGYPPDYGLPIMEDRPKQEMVPPPANAKTLRVWQRGGVPVLPPVSALKRAFTSSRNSPDEGYQEGCGTDV